jgi:hypothetical protein
VSKLIDRALRAFLGDLSAPTPDTGRWLGSCRRCGDGSRAAGDGCGAAEDAHGIPAEREALDAALPALTAARDRLARLVDRDTASYDGVTAAYKLPRKDARRRAAARRPSRRRCAAPRTVPLDVMRTAAEAARQGLAVARAGNPSASSDAARRVRAASGRPARCGAERPHQPREPPRRRVRAGGRRRGPAPRGGDRRGRPRGAAASGLMHRACAGM